MSQTTSKIRAHIEFRNWTFTPWKGAKGPNITGMRWPHKKYFVHDEAIISDNNS